MTTFTALSKVKECFYYVLLCTGILILTPYLSIGQSLPTCISNDADYVGGTVYYDYDNNGVKDATATYSENGAMDITVVAYDDNGNLVATTRTDAKGEWALNVSMGTKVRVEFHLPSHLEPSKSLSGGSVQTDVAIATAPDCMVNLGVYDADKFTSTDPEVVTVCFVKGYAPATSPVIVSVDYSDGSNDITSIAPYLESVHPVKVPVSEVGAVWGLAYSKRHNRMYTGSYFKPGTVVSPDGIGAIYTIDNSTNDGTDASVTQADLLTTVNAGVDPTGGIYQGGESCGANWATAFSETSKIGFGGFAMNDKDNLLYTINLFDKTLVIIPLNSSGDAVQGAIQTVPMEYPTNCSATDVRPFAVKYHLGKVYIGMVCSAESTQLASDLKAYVYTYEPGDVTISKDPVLEFDLNYPRAATFANLNAAWQPWLPSWDGANPMPANHRRGSTVSYPSAVLTDIDFERGDMVISFMDRFGDQFNAGKNPEDCVNGSTNTSIPGGEILKAGANSDGTFTIENNGAITSAINGVQTSAGGVGNNEGPGSGEFYHYDFYAGNAHRETALGGLAVWEGHNDVLTTSFDPSVALYEATNGANNTARWGSGGIVWHNAKDGSFNKAWEGYYQSYYGKGNGFADIVLIDPAKAPIEIGNYIWDDMDGDGVQDPNEPGIAGVQIDLYDNTGAVVGSVTTDADGFFVFDDSNVTGGN